MREFLVKSVSPAGSAFAEATIRAATADEAAFQAVGLPVRRANRGFVGVLCAKVYFRRKETTSSEETLTLYHYFLR